MRPLVDDDRKRLVDAFYRLSEGSRYRRFFAPVRDLSEETLDYLVEIDHHDHEAIVALDAESGDLIGVARYVRQAPGSERAEAAVVVADDWQGLGLGRAYWSASSAAPVRRESCASPRSCRQTTGAR